MTKIDRDIRSKACTPTLAVFAAFALATPALSQTNSAIPAQAYGPVWTGFYVGGAFGAGALVNKVNTSGGGTALNLDGLGNSGVLGSIYGGVDYQVLPKAIIGALAEASWSGFLSSTSAQVPGAGAVVNTSTGLGWSLLGRAGLLANPSTLLYLVGGYTGQNIYTSGTAVTGGAVANFSRSDTLHGWTVGPGLETMLADGWSAKLEYRYSQFGSTTPSGTAINVLPSTQAIRAGLTYRFGGLSAAATDDPPPSRLVAANWTGVYVGVAGGGGVAVNNVSTAFGGVSTSITGAGQSLLGSVFAGADYQLAPRALAGLMGDFTWAGMQSTATLSAGGANASIAAQANRAWSVMARVGYLPTPSTLLYAAAGYAGQNVTSTAAALAGGASAFASQDNTFHGWTVGPGVETIVSGGWSTRLEYRYSQFQQQQILGGVGIQPETHTIRAGLAYKFGVGASSSSIASE